MRFPPLLRAGHRASSCLVLVAAAMAAQTALAVPPSFIASSVTAPIPASPNEPSVLVNARQLQIVSGSAPINLSIAGVYINGVPTEDLFISPFGSDVGGAVCLGIFNSNYVPAPGDVVTFDVQAMNALQESASTTLMLIDGAAPTVDPQDSNALTACSDPNAAPMADAGADRTVQDSDGQPGETVILAGSGTDPEGDFLTYEWLLDGQPLASGQTISASLPDGVSTLTLRVTDEGGAVATDDVMITVAASAGPVANAGPNRSVADSDGEPGESVTLDGTQSSDPDGAIVAYQWFRQNGADVDESLGSGAILSVVLPDGANTIRLQVADNVGNTASTVVVITVGTAAVPDELAELPDLTPNQAATARVVDRVCAALDEMNTNGVLTQNQRDLLAGCENLLLGNTPENQRAALDSLVGDDFARARTQTMQFTTTQQSNVMDRLVALRGGASGLSLAGLNIVLDGKPIPLAQLQAMAQQLLGGGASGDEPGGLLSDKWGLWARGNYSFGDKDSTASSPGFDAKQWVMSGGLDYRLSNLLVIGGSLAYGESRVTFNPRGGGRLDTQSWSASLYGSLYASRSVYLDGVFNVADVSYGAQRSILFVGKAGQVEALATGDTDGMTYSGGLSGGYDLPFGGFTLSPNLGLFYIDGAIDGFAERGAGGLNLLYDDQDFKSLTANLGLRMTYAWNLSWGVMLPHLRADFVREFQDGVEAYGVRFAADPDAGRAPPIRVQTESPDQSYWRLAAGLSAQFKYGISGYVEYQRLEGLQYITFQDVSLGLRVQRSF